MKFTDPNVRPDALAVIADNIPADLRLIPHWVNWEWEWNEDKQYWDKPPRDVKSGGYARTNDPVTWTMFEEALKDALLCDGVGVVLTLPLKLVGIDLDNCRDPRSGVINNFARKVVASLNTYTEISPSGTGLRLILRGSIPVALKTDEIEIYSTGRYLTMTGHRLDGTPETIEERTQAILDLHAEETRQRNSRKKPSAVDSGATTSAPPADRSAPTPADLNLLEKAKRANGTGQKFSDLFAGDWETYYPDRTVADEWFCGRLAFWFGKDFGRMDRVFRVSGMMRPKWDEKHSADGRTYGQMTLQDVVGKAEEVYTPRASADGDDAPAEGSKVGRRTQASIGVRWASDVKAVPIEWLYEDGSLAVGKVLALVGDPGCGKTLIAEDLTARITTGSPWATAGKAPLGNVLLFEVEDAESDTTKPRLIAHGADCSRVALYGPEHGFVLEEDGTKRFLNLERDMSALRDLITETNAKLVVISPLMSFLGKQDTKGDSEVRAVLTPLMGLAAELRVAILVIIHLNKNSDRAAMHRVQGSVAFVAGPRMVRICAKDPDEKGRYLMMRLKTSNSPDSGEALAYRIVSWCWHCHKEAGGKYCVTCREYSTARLVWDGIVEGVDPDEVLNRKRPEGGKGNSKAMALLDEMVPDETHVMARDVYAAAEARQISIEAVKTARYRAGISAEKGDFSGGWEWWRPTTRKGSGGTKVSPKVSAQVDSTPSQKIEEDKSLESTKCVQGVASQFPTPKIASSEGVSEGVAGGRNTTCNTFAGSPDSKGEIATRSPEGVTSSLKTPSAAHPTGPDTFGGDPGGHLRTLLDDLGMATGEGAEGA